jgi:hypothetical protein
MRAVLMDQNVADDHTRLIENALKAYWRCRETNSEWGIAFWHSVYVALMKKYGQ